MYGPKTKEVKYMVVYKWVNCYHLLQNKHKHSVLTESMTNC